MRVLDCEEEDVKMAIDEEHEPDKDCEAGKSEVGQTDSGLLSCWSQKQYDHFWKAYPWMTVKVDKNGQGHLGCSVCRQLGNLGCEQEKQMHLSSEWRGCLVSISQSSTKSKQQTSIHKKLFLHQKSDAHKAACNIVETRKTTMMETHIAKMRESEYDVTLNCLRTAYYVAHQARPFTDHDDLIHLQQANGANMGSILHSPSCCTEMVKVIAADMRDQLYKVIRDTDAKIAIIIDESTTLSQKSALIERGFSQMNLIATDSRSRLLVRWFPIYPISCLCVLMGHCRTCGILRQPRSHGC